MSQAELVTAGDVLVRTWVTLGHSDITMQPIGLGCVTMSQSYGDADRETVAGRRAEVVIAVR